MKNCIRSMFVCVMAAGLGMMIGTDARAQAGGRPLWTNYCAGAGADFLSDLAVDRSGNVFVTGYTAQGAPFDFLTIKLSGTGTPLWTNRYDGPANTNDFSSAIALDSNGNAFVTGISGNSSVTIKYSGTGVALWTNYISGVPIADIAVDASGNVFVTGGNGHFVTVAYSNAGAPLWTNHYDGPGTGGAKAIAVDGSGNVIVTGASDMTTVKYSGAGVLLWAQRDESPFSPTASAVVVDGSGNIFVSGGAGLVGYSVIAKYSAAGTLLWTNGGGGAIAVDSSGNLYVATTSSNTVSGNYDFLTRKYSGSGGALWTNRFNAPDNVDDYILSMALDSSGNVFVHGETISDLDGVAFFQDFTTLAYSSGGVPLWTNIYHTGWAIHGEAVAVDPNGNVIAAGTTADGNNDIVIIKYSAILPQLAILRTVTNTVAISWPSPSTGFGLQQNSSTINSLNWSNVTAGVQDDGTNKTFIGNPPTGTRFYRLYKP